MKRIKSKNKKKFKRNVHYLAQWTGDDKYDSPTAVIERTLDEYRQTPPTKKDKILVLFLDAEGDISYRSAGFKDQDELTYLAYQFQRRLEEGSE